MTFQSLEPPQNEPILNYNKGSRERTELEKKLLELRADVMDIPIIIGGEEIYTKEKMGIRIPHEKDHLLAEFSLISEKEAKHAIEVSKDAKEEWLNYSWEKKWKIFQKAADLLSTKWRATLNAATMLCQSKIIYEAEIDAACEIIDFLRFNVYFASEIISNQPNSPNKNIKNQMEYRPLEGFVFAITPFNFTSIGANLCTAPAIMGNVVLWKPSTKVVFSNYLFYKILEEAGLPKGIINFIPGRGKVIGPIILNHKDLAGVHFTGSTRTLNEIWEITSKNFMNYKNIPRIVGETGGKGFFIVHKSANIEQAVTGLIRGAFGYQGQKCSAASRGYISKEIWPRFKMKLIEEVETVKHGSPEDPTNFMGAVIDQGAFDKISSYIKYSLETEKTNQIIFGGKCDSSKGYFIEPTIIETKDPDDKLMKEEIFGPVVTVYVYDNFSNMLEKVDNTSPYGLTGCIFAEDKEIIEETKHKLRYSAGNFYINDKPTGAVVGQQPFGGARASGTNDKAGSFLNLVRWTSPRVIKENFKPSIFYKYDYMTD